MNTYCAGELIILGVIEHNQGKHALQNQEEVLQFKVNQNIWLNIEIGQLTKDGLQTSSFNLKDLIVCEYKYKVLPHFILYPRLASAQLISQKSFDFSELLE